MPRPAPRSAFRPLALLLLVAAGGGCAAALPTYPWPGPQAALAELAARQARVHTVSAHASLYLRRPDGQTVTLEAALAAQGPDRLRLRAWKLQQAVFDLTILPDGLWLWSSPPPGAAAAPPPAVPARAIAQTWALLAGGIFQPGRGQIEDDGGPTFTVRAPLSPLSPLGERVAAQPPGEGGTRLVEAPSSLCLALIDRPTLTVREYRFVDATGHLRQTLRLDHYRLVGDLPFPYRWVADGAAGRITLDLDEVDLNSPLPAGALTPPARARKQP